MESGTDMSTWDETVLERQ